MKKITKAALFLLALTLAVCLAGGVPQAKAADVIANNVLYDADLKWVLWDDGELVLSPYLTDSAYIPNMDADSTQAWLSFKSQIKTVTIGQYVTRVGSNAFRGCSNLASVNFSNGSITAVESDAFNGCGKLTSLTLPAGVSSISSTAFRGTSGSLKLRVASPTGDTAKALTAAGYSFYKGSDNAFALQCSSSGTISLTAYTGSAASVTIPSHVNYINGGVFQNNAALSSVTIPSSVTDMGTHVFAGCTGLTRVTLNEGLTRINGSTFDGCASLASVNIPASVTSIESYAFSGCSALSSLTLTDNIASVGNTAFSNTGSLRVYVPTPKGSAAWAASSACDYYLDGDNAFALSYDGTTCTLKHYTGDAVNVTVPSYVDYIGGNAFQGNAALASVTIPSSVTDMGTHVFAGCTGLTRVTLNEGLTRINSSTFDGCASLDSVNIPASVTSIESYAFSGCSALSSLTLTDNVASVGNTAFSNTGSLRVYVPTPKGSAAWAASSACDYYLDGDNAFALNYDGTTCTLKHYTGDAVNVTVPSYVDYIGGNAFQGNAALSSVTIPSSVTDMGTHVFAGCTGLTRVTLNDGLTRINGSTFDGCSSLDSVNIPASVTSIENYAFYGCSALSSLTLPDSVISIRNTAFANTNADLYLTVGCVSFAKDWSDNNSFTEVENGEPTSGKRYQLAHRPETDAAVAPVCLETGLTEGSHCADCSVILVAQEIVPALGDDWGAPGYVWNDAHTLVTATRVCKRDAAHIESEPAGASSAVATPATCTVMGKTTYTSDSFQNPAFEAQAITLTDVPALGHDWGTPGYVWNDAHTLVTATRVCKCDAAHIESEPAGASSAVTTPATCTVMGKTTYTSDNFQNPAFEAQAVTLTDVPMIAHTWTLVPSIAAAESDGIRGGIACAACGERQTQDRVVSAGKVLRLPAMLKTIERESFLGSAAEQIVVPVATTFIGDGAFANCEHLLLVVIPSPEITIEGNPFTGDVAVICPDNSYIAAWCDDHSIPHNP